MKRKSISKILALLLASSTCLAGCGQQQAVSTETKGSEVGSIATEVEEVKPYWELLNEVSDTSELPDWTGDKLEVSVWFAGGTDAVMGSISDTNVTFKELERVTGVSFSVDESFTNNGDTIDAKLPKLVASKDFPTMVMGYNIGKQLNELYDNGYLVDLTKYLEEGYLDQITYLAPLDELGGLLWDNMKAKDGSYIMFPYSSLKKFYDASGYELAEYDPSYYANYWETPLTTGGNSYLHAIYVREDVLQALYPDALTMEEIIQIYKEKGGFTEEQIFDIPLNSSEDFFQFLRDIKAELEKGEYVGSDGKAMEVTFGPHTGTDNWDWMQTLPKLVSGFSVGVDYFAYADLTAQNESDLIQYAFSSEPYVNWMKELNALVNEDVISQNSLVDNSASFDEKYLNGHYAVLYGGSFTSPVNSLQSEDWSYRPVWVNVPVNNDFTGFDGLGTPSYFGIFNTDLTDEQTEQLIHAINYMNSEVGVNNFFWGPASAGLFEVDADGNRTYTDQDVYDCMMLNVDNGTSFKYGLINASVAEQSFTGLPIIKDYRFQVPRYLGMSGLERNESKAYVVYNPGTLSGRTLAENAVKVNTVCKIYNSLGLSVKGIEQFWAARDGFEQQMKKVLVATPENFETELNELFEYAEQNGLTETTLQEFNDLFVETNRAQLEGAGVIK